MTVVVQAGSTDSFFLEAGARFDIQGPCEVLVNRWMNKFRVKIGSAEQQVGPFLSDAQINLIATAETSYTIHPAEVWVTPSVLAGTGGAGQVGTSSGSTVQQALDVFRSQVAGGIVAPGVNVIAGYEGNAIAGDIGDATIAGGGNDGRQNIIGGDVSTVNTSADNVTELGTVADYSVITGGYDNVASGLMSVISGAHNYTKKESTHGTIGGGSVQRIDSGDYHTIAGGTKNSIDTVGGSRCSIGGGSDNTISGVLSRSTIGGGGANTVSGSGSVIAGGFTNACSGETATVGGGTLNQATAKYATVGGGFTCIASAARAVVSGGYINNASGVSATVSGGGANTASGASAVIAGGTNNFSSNDNTSVGGGDQNTASASGCTVSGGKLNTATANYAVVGGGFTNAASASNSAVVGGSNNTASGVGSGVLNGEQNTAAGDYSVTTGVQSSSRVQGQHAHSAGRFSVVGDAQTCLYVLRRISTSATPVALRVDGGGGYLTIPDDTTWAFSILIVARRTDADGESAAYTITGCIDSNAGAVALVGTPTVTVLSEDTVGWGVACTADNTNKALTVTCTGEAAKTIRWVARVETSEVTG